MSTLNKKYPSFSPPTLFLSTASQSPEDPKLCKSPSSLETPRNSLLTPFQLHGILLDSGMTMKLQRIILFAISLGLAGASGHAQTPGNPPGAEKKPQPQASASSK